MSVMSPPFGYSAITAKCRARSAKLLKYDDYVTLCGMKSLSDAAAFLSEKGSYKEELEGISLSYISRSELENLLGKAYRRTCSELFRFSDGELKYLMSVIMKKTEIYEIMRKAKECAASADSQGDVEAFSSVFGDTEYSKVMNDCINTTDGKASIDVVRLEAALYSAYYRNLMNSAEDTGDKVATEIIRKIVDLRNTDVIIRARHNFGMKAEAVYPYLLDVHGGISKKELADFCTMDREKLFTMLTKHFGIQFDSENYYSANHRNMFLYKYYKKAFASTKPSFGIPFAFLGLCETEVINLVHVIEGLRYGLPPEKILDCVASEIERGDIH